MPIVAIILGVILLAAIVRGTEHELVVQLGKDFGGSGFLAWGAAIVALGAIGYASPLRRVSDLALALVIVAMALANRGLFAQLASVIEHPPAPSQAVPLSSYGGSSGGSGGSQPSSGGGLASFIPQAAQVASSIVSL